MGETATAPASSGPVPASDSPRSIPLALGIWLDVDCPGDLAPFRHFARLFAAVHDNLPRPARAVLWSRWIWERPEVWIVEHLDYNTPVVWAAYLHEPNRFVFAWDTLSQLDGDLWVACVIAHELAHAVAFIIGLPRLESEVAADWLAESWGYPMGACWGSVGRTEAAVFPHQPRGPVITGDEP